MAIPNSTTDHSSNRTLAGMAYDKTHTKTILVGGKKIDGTSFGDTWAIANGGSWSQLSPAVSLQARFDFAMAYSNDDGYILASGGIDNTTNKMFSDTWFWNNSTWTQFSSLTPFSTQPSQRYGHEMISLDGYSNFLMFGGIGSNLIARYALLSETWLFSTSTKVWAQLTSSANTPPERAHFGIGFDGYFAWITMGEGNGNVLFNDVWKINALQQQWNQVQTSGTIPTARKGAAVCWDGHNNRLFSFGGYTYTGANGGLSNETFVLSTTGVWSLLSTPTHPTRRYNASMVFDSGTNKIIMVGGIGLDGAPLGDQWVFDCVAGTWAGSGDFQSAQTTGPVSDH